MDAASICRIATHAEVIHLERQIAALQTLPEGQSYTTHDVAGSITLISDPQHGRKLNHTYGFGMFGPVAAKDLHAIELAYESCGSADGLRLRPELDVCEYADSSALALLSMSYSVTGSICQYQRSLADFEVPPLPVRGFDVSSSPGYSREAIIEASIEGFRSGGRDARLLRLLAYSATARKDTTIFSATMEGELIGTAAMALIEVSGCKVALLYLDSCLERARGKGVHMALLLERLRMAKQLGCDFATASAREGSGSARNIQRAGLERLFVCKTYTRDDKGAIGARLEGSIAGRTNDIPT